jgi:hypothetical protein
MRMSRDKIISVVDIVGPIFANPFTFRAHIVIARSENLDELRLLLDHNSALARILLAILLEQHRGLVLLVRRERVGKGLALLRHLLGDASAGLGCARQIGQLEEVLLMGISCHVKDRTRPGELP